MLQVLLNALVLIAYMDVNVGFKIRLVHIDDVTTDMTSEHET